MLEFANKIFFQNQLLLLYRLPDVTQFIKYIANKFSFVNVTDLPPLASSLNL
jgi:hypothetical protein